MCQQLVSLYGKIEFVIHGNHTLRHFKRVQSFEKRTERGERLFLPSAQTEQVCQFS